MAPRPTPALPRTPQSEGAPADGDAEGGHIELEGYAPAYINWISNKLSRGASQYYLGLFGVGVEVWRLLMELAAKGRTTAQDASRALGMNKASVSRAMKTMQDQGLIALSLDRHDGRLRHARLTAKGRALHQRIERLALHREKVFLSVLDAQEQAQLMQMLRRLHEHLPEVERQTQLYIDTHGLTAASTERT